ncbi:hypothetical protein RN001_004413 [Aquatica leii]|uniref:DUF7869 domain-containing protein n=1 Tax=Aquatica leii TaxID=1421715 RepID=A0AAN7PBB8_9COLE|nr:hypothetical protein RN001_004413 [Aquatica leii]
MLTLIILLPKTLIRVRLMKTKYYDSEIILYRLKVRKTTLKKQETFEKKRKKSSTVVQKGDTRAARLKNKIGRNLGNFYKTKKGRTVPKRECKPLSKFTSVAFYKRQLWTFNLSLHDCVSKQAYCHMRHEVIAGRGANQVGSCLYSHLISNIPPEVKQVILYSDTCGGQNKNSHLVAMFFTLLQNSGSLEILDHKFLVSGHTHMECDTDHSLIERTRTGCN